MNDRLSLPTISGLAINPASYLANRYLETKDWITCRDEAIKNNIMKIDKTASSVRYISYTTKLLKTLTNEELQLLASSVADTKRSMMWLAFCLTYPLVGKFADTVINQKFIHHDFTLTSGDWNEFLSRESYEHHAIEDIGKATRVKARSVLFGNLKSVGYLSSSNEIKEAILAEEVISILGENLRFFPYYAGGAK